MGRQRDNLRDRYPLCTELGRDYVPLDDEAALAATTEGRIRSVWPFMVRRAAAFQKTLGPRGQANFDLEDTLAELWVAIAERDHKWDRHRGRYITFVGTVVDHALDSIRDRARTVQSPRNSSWRLKEYRVAEEAGTLTPRLAKSQADIRRASGELKDADSKHGQIASGDDPAGLAERREEEASLRTALSALDPTAAAVVRSAFGLDGNPAMTIDRIAAALGRSPDAVRRAKARALATLRGRLRELGHPAAA